MTKQERAVSVVWIVEMFDERSGKWGPTVGAALSRRDGRKIRLPEWRGKCPDDKFRLVKYTALRRDPGRD